MPDSFFRSEHDSIRCLLLLKRLVFKSELIIKQVDQIHNIPEKLNTTVPEELMAVCEVCLFQLFLFNNYIINYITYFWI